eukprot:TRINITY_DN14621_c0_g1_i1.p1 TRINITY_DN14621_c0_g1~~TRINITY_DN14621_c0_g1_i1.p1  ORF type:complete len:138 (-),score=11.11 TRINITY_DN14621_c0_g1_i1:60-473(-)
MPSAIWTLPEIATVGDTEDELIARGEPYKKCIGYFEDTAKWALRTKHEVMEAEALDWGDRENAFLKIVFKPSSYVVMGVHIVGPGSSELIQYAHSCIGKSLYFILRTAFTAVTLSRCLLYTSPSPRDRTRSRMPSSA